MTDVHAKGLSELQKFLDQLPAEIERNVMRGALRAGAKVVLEEAKRNVPVGHGDLQKSLYVTVRSKRGTVVAKVKTDLYYAQWVEYGTKQHLITITDGDRPVRMTRHGLRAYSLKTINKMVNRGSLVIGKNFVGPIVHHPGARPNPFMRPALDGQAQAALVAVGEYIKTRLKSKHGLNTSSIEITAEKPTTEVTHDKTAH